MWFRHASSHMQGEVRGGGDLRSLYATRRLGQVAGVFGTGQLLPSKFKKTGTWFSRFTSFALKYNSIRSKYTLTDSRSGLKASSLPPTAPAMINL